MKARYVTACAELMRGVWTGDWDSWLIIQLEIGIHDSLGFMTHHDSWLHWDSWLCTQEIKRRGLCREKRVRGPRLSPEGGLIKRWGTGRRRGVKKWGQESTVREGARNPGKQGVAEANKEEFQGEDDQSFYVPGRIRAENKTLPLVSGREWRGWEPVVSKD